MNPLTIQRRERNRWAVSAGLLVVALITGVLGLRPAFADGTAASCTVVVDAAARTAEWQWSGVVAGAPVVGFVVDAQGDNITVDTNAPDDVMGYGPSGSWASTTAVAAGATGFGIWIDPALGGGALTCTSIGNDGDYGSGGETTTTTVVEETTTTVVETTTTNTVVEETTTVPESTTTVPQTTTTLPTTPDLTGALRLDCDTLELIVTVTNAGDAPGDAELIIDGASITVSVPAGQTVEQRVPVTPGQPVVAEIRTAGGSVLAELSADPACDEVPADIDARVVLDCTTDEVRLVVSNTGGRPETVTVSVNGADTELTMQPGSSVEHVAHVVAGQDLEVTVVTSGGRTVLSEQWTGACDEPRPELDASLAVDCTDNQVVITIRNTGNAAGTASYDVNGTTASVRVEPGATEVVTVAIEGAAPLDIAVWAGDTSLAREVRDVACDQPSPELTAVAALDCGSETVTVTVFNNGDAAGEVVVSIDGRPQTVAVPAGQTVVIQERVTIGGDASVVVTADGETVYEQTFDATCSEQQPALTAVAAVDCSSGRVVVSIRNDGDRSASVDVTLNGQVSIVEVDPGVVVDWTRPVAPGADVSVRVSYRNVVLTSLDQSDVCRPQGPIIAADIVLDCANRAIVVTITNDGTAAGEATLTIGTATSVIAVPAGSRIVRSEPVSEDAPVTASVAVNGTVIRSVTLTADCTANTTPQPSASIARSCDRTDAAVALNNAGTAPATFTITVNGTPRTEVVEPGQNRTISIPLVEDTRYEIVVTSGSTTTLASSTFVHDCTNVLDYGSGRSVPTSPTGPGYQPYNLAHTGVDAATLVGAGVAAVVAGGLALSAASLRRRRLAV